MGGFAQVSERIIGPTELKGPRSLEILAFKVSICPCQPVDGARTVNGGRVGNTLQDFLSLLDIPKNNGKMGRHIVRGCNIIFL